MTLDELKKVEPKQLFNYSLQASKMGRIDLIKLIGKIAHERLVNHEFDKNGVWIKKVNYKQILTKDLQTPTVEEIERIFNE